jgi:hypothetical protein
MSAAYFTAAIPEPFQILGLKLKPLSIGRYRILKRLNCAFVSEVETKAEAADLIIGVLVCSMRCQDFMEIYDSNRLEMFLRKWSRSISPMPWIGFIPLVGKWWRARYSFDMFEKMNLFKRYIEQGSEAPKYFDESGDKAVTGAHWSHSIEVTLRSECNWGKLEVDEDPLTKALADYFKYLENQGLVRLMTEDDIVQGDQNAKVYEEYLRKCKEAGCQA